MSDSDLSKLSEECSVIPFHHRELLFLFVFCLHHLGPSVKQGDEQENAWRYWNHTSISGPQHYHAGMRLIHCFCVLFICGRGERWRSDCRRVQKLFSRGRECCSWHHWLTAWRLKSHCTRTLSLGGVYQPQIMMHAVNLIFPAAASCNIPDSQMEKNKTKKKIPDVSARQLIGP